MTKGELWKSVTISAVIALVFGVIGGHIIHNALEMVGIFGEELGSDARSRVIYAESHRWVHLFAAACGLALGWFLSRRNWWMFAIALLAIFACGAYGIQNMYGFSVKNRVGVTVAKADDKAAANRQYENARKDLQEQIGWLQRMSTQEDGRERRRLLAEVDAKRKELSALKPPVVTADNAIADPSATGFAKLTGYSAETWTFGLPLALAILMFLGESFSFVVVGHMLAAIVAMFATYFASRATTVAGNSESPVKSSSKPGGSDNSSGGNMKSDPATIASRGENVIDLPARIASPPQLQTEDACNSEQPETVAQPPPTVSSEAPRVTAPAPPRVPSSTKSSKREKRIFREWFAAQPDGARWETDLAMAEAAGVSPGTVSRETRKLDGTRLHRVRMGRTVQTTKLARRPVWKNGGAVHAFG